MKTKLLFILCVISFSLAHAEFRQTGYRWRSDDGTETTATWKAAKNTPITISSTSDIVRLRLEVFNYETCCGSGESKDDLIEYRKGVDGSWTIITDDATTNHFQFVNSTNVANGSATTQQLSSGDYFIAERFISNYATSNSNTVNIIDRHYSETEYSIKPTTNIINDTYYFRFYDLNDNAGSTYAELVFNSTLSNNTLNKNDFSYNNPITDRLNITSKDQLMNTSIFNVTGSKILESSKNAIDTSNLTSGIYIVKTTTVNGKTATFKIVK